MALIFNFSMQFNGFLLSPDPHGQTMGMDLLQSADKMPQVFPSL